MKHLKKVFNIPFGNGGNKLKPYHDSSTYSIQNFLLIWLDNNIDEVNDSDCYHTIKQLRTVVNTVDIFRDADKCIDFITSVQEEKIFMIISGALGEILMPTIHTIEHVYSIYIFCRNKSKHKQWSQAWPKVRGVFTEILPICDELRQDVQQYDQNAISVSFVSKIEELLTQNLNQINQSFMYTQILKEILLTIKFNQKSIQEFIVYCREKFADNPKELDNVNRLEREYHRHSPIWWYTYDCFLYAMLNRALRMMEVDIIIKLGFFIRDLHENIVKLHSEQFLGHQKCHSFTVYRGQCLTKTDFNQLIKTVGGFLCFNNFLSTSKNRDISLKFARRSFANSYLTGVLFIITIDPSMSSTQFAAIKNVSYYQTEREILFSMHSIFYVATMKQIEYHNDRLWQVELTLTSNDDPQRRELTERISKETSGWTGWHRLGQFLIMIGQYTKAEGLYRVLLEQADEKTERAYCNHHLGVVKDNQGDYNMAINFYEESLKINREILSPDHHFMASTYNGLGLIYSKKGDHSKALSLLKKALEIFQKTLSQYNSHIAIAYGNLGKAYYEKGDYAEALLNHEKALEIFRETLPLTDSHMATVFYDIGNVYDKMGELSKALLSHEAALEIRKKVLTSEHPLLADSYRRFGEIYEKINKHSEELPGIKHDIDLGQNSLHATNTNLDLQPD